MSNSLRHRERRRAAGTVKAKAMRAGRVRHSWNPRDKLSLIVDDFRSWVESLTQRQRRVWIGLKHPGRFDRDVAVASAALTKAMGS